MIRRPPRSTQELSSAASDVYKRQRCERASEKDYFQFQLLDAGGCGLKWSQCHQSGTNGFSSVHTTKTRSLMSIAFIASKKNPSWLKRHTLVHVRTNTHARTHAHTRTHTHTHTHTCARERTHTHTSVTCNQKQYLSKPAAGRITRRSMVLMQLYLLMTGRTDNLILG